MKIIMRAILSALLAAFGFGCDKQAQQSQVKNVDPATLKPGPTQHDELSKEQLERISKLHQTFSEVDSSSLEKWIDNFKRDMNPDKELSIWEKIADVYTKYCSQRDLTLAAKRDVLQVALVRSTTPNDEEALKLLNLKTLTKEEAEKVMRMFLKG